MGRKGKRRQEARRRARQRREEQQRSPEEDAVPAGVTEPQQEEAVHPAAAVSGAGHGRAGRKRAKRGGGLWGRVRRVRLSPWLITVPVLVIAVGVLAALILTSGSSGTTGAPSEAPPDPRGAGLPIDVSFDI